MKNIFKIMLMGTSVLVGSEALSSGAPAAREYWEVCPTLSTSDLLKAAHGETVFTPDDRDNYVTPVDAGAAENIKKALEGVADKKISPKESHPRNVSPFGKVCVYPVESNGIGEAWVTLKHITFPGTRYDNTDNLLENYKRLMAGETVYPGFKFQSIKAPAKDDTERFEKLTDPKADGFGISSPGGRRATKGTETYTIIRRYIDDVSGGSAREKFSTYAEFSLTFDPKAAE